MIAAEMAAALRQVAFPGPDIRMQADRRKINVVSRTAAIDADRHQAIADQPFGSREQRIDRLGAVRQVGADDRVLIGALGESRRPRARRSRDNGAGRRPPAEEWARARSCCPLCSRSSRPAAVPVGAHRPRVPARPAGCPGPGEFRSRQPTTSPLGRARPDGLWPPFRSRSPVSLDALAPLPASRTRKDSTRIPSVSTPQRRREHSILVFRRWVRQGEPDSRCQRNPLDQAAR